MGRAAIVLRGTGSAIPLNEPVLVAQIARETGVPAKRIRAAVGRNEIRHYRANRTLLLVDRPSALTFCLAWLAKYGPRA